MILKIIWLVFSDFKAYLTRIGCFGSLFGSYLVIDGGVFVKVGFIGFGEVSYTLSKLLLSQGVEVLTALEGRSEKTKKLVNSLELTVLDEFFDVARNSDFLISANSPNSALAIAIKYGPHTDGLFIDFNNISPNTAGKIADYLSEDHFLDAAIFGKVNSDRLNIFFSGKKARELVDLLSNLSCDDVDLNFLAVSDKIGDVSKLKMLRSLYTKSLSALLIETFEIAETLNLTEDLWRILALSEGERFEDSSKSRIKNSLKSSTRKYEELEELLEFLDSNDINEYDEIMIKASKDKFEYLKNRKEDSFFD